MGRHSSYGNARPHSAPDVRAPNIVAESGTARYAVVVVAMRSAVVRDAAPHSDVDGTVPDAAAAVR